METSKNKTLLNGCYAHIFFIVGYPGAGKGTQSKLIASKYGLEHLSVGDYIRAEIAAGSPRSAMLADKLRKAQDGKPFPCKSHWPGFLIDGFPIKVDEVIQFECEIQACTCVLHFDIADKEALFQRLLKRGKSSGGRPEDNSDRIMKRLKCFKFAALVKYYRRKGKVLHVCFFKDFSTVMLH
uniref:Adenylate kinase n=1 Tax=Ditylenchus dipsaci TaxID=166011 RepID=A0A915ESA1_9BILA